MDRNLMIITTVGVVAILAIAAVAIVLTNDNGDDSGFNHSNKVVDPKLSAGEINLTAEDLGEGWDVMMLMIARQSYGLGFDNSSIDFYNESDDVRMTIFVQLIGSQQLAEIYANMTIEMAKLNFSSYTEPTKCQNSILGKLTEIVWNQETQMDEDAIFATLIFQDLDAIVTITFEFDIDDSDPLIEKIMSALENRIHENATDPPSFNHRQRYIWHDETVLNLTVNDLGSDWVQTIDEYRDEGFVRCFENRSNESIWVKMTNYNNTSYAMEVFAELIESYLEYCEITDLSKCQQSFQIPGETDRESVYYFQDLCIIVEIVILSDDNADALASQVMSILEQRIHDVSRFSLMNTGIVS